MPEVTGLTIIARAFLTGAAFRPRPADAAAAALAFQRWEEAAEAAGGATAARARALAADSDGRALLSAIFGNSPYLTQCAVRDIAFACELLAEGPRSAWDRTVATLAGLAPQHTGSDEIMDALRRAKRRSALAVALADLCGIWPVEQVGDALSAFAEGALSLSVRHLLAKAAANGELAAGADGADAARGSGWIVLGMGKLGGRELNYSSDIDLIVLFDDEIARYTGKTSLQQCMVRLTRDLVRLMAERTAAGYVFRTDLRLRPDPGSTPVAISTRAAETYYESAGQNWERAAMIKARPVAGDIVAGQAFLEILRPFVWRRNLDFAAIQDIHSIKRQIHAQRGGASIAVAGHNIKLGRGGIREIEFFAQTQQLIWGGRHPDLRARATCDALRALAGSGRLESIVTGRLIQAHRFLRRLENRLQMVDDQQTHSMPETEAALDGIAAMMGYADVAAFRAALLEELRTVESHYAVLFEKSPDLSGPGNLVFTGADDDPETLKTLERLGFRDPAMVAGRIRVWHHGRYAATRSARARELLTELIPAILENSSRTIDPDAALLKFDDFLRALPAGVQLLSLFSNNPAMLELVARIMGSAPRLADWLSRHPILLDGVLSTDFFEAPPTETALEEELAGALEQARDFQDVLHVSRRWNNDRTFQLGAQILDSRITVEDAAVVLSNVAATVIRAILPATAREFERAHGAVPGGAFAVVAFGKLGGAELMVGSDLDLMFVFDAPGKLAESDGAKPLASPTYFARLCQRFIGAMNAPTADGRLYEIDMRLRPAGASGPIAISLEAFARYQNAEAWTWEHMALTRARVIAAPGPLAASLKAQIRTVLTAERDAAALVREVADMRERMAREHRPRDWWAIKHYRGGLIDIEFIAQYLQLRHAAAHPGVLSPNTADALARLAEAGMLDGEVAAELIEALRLWRRLQGVLRLAFGGGSGGREASAKRRDFIAHVAGAADSADLERRCLDVAARVRDHYAAIVDRPVGAGAAGEP